MRRALLTLPFLLFLAPGAAHATTDHCPDHQTYPKTKAQGDNLNQVVLPAGTPFCVKGGISTSGNILTANGIQSLKGYLGTGQDVSYYVIYGQSAVIPPSTTTTVPLPIPPVATPELPHNLCTDTNGYTFKTDQPCPLPIVPGPATPAPLTELPRTGIDLGFLTFMGLGLTAAGAVAWRWAR